MPPAPEASRADQAKADQLIVVGASAGGVEALSRFVGSLPADLPAPVVIAQHLDPARPSHLAEILARQSPLPVRSVEPREELTAGTVFVVPSNRHVTITDHHVDVHPDAARRPTPSVDLLLATAAATFGERLIAVVLTGSGSDGAAGAHAVKEAGGTVIIQDPDEAAFPSMPRSLAPSVVDLSLPVEGMGAVLAELLATPHPGEAGADSDLARLLERLRERHGIDFGAYKPATITRRLWRRRAAAGAATTADYLGYLEAHPEEEQRLIADFLIKVTRFFRDPALFARLRKEIVPELVAAAGREGRELRMWSAGCATGEEAYSLALLVAEALAGRPDPPPVRIFATDLDQTALGFARGGVYPATALADVPAELRDQFFVARDGAFEATKALRGLVVFGAHDLAQRPPFPDTDLVLCRNVLIYFAPALQRRALAIFAYSLREGGVLVLGKAETTGPADAAGGRSWPSTAGCASTGARVPAPCCRRPACRPVGRGGRERGAAPPRPIGAGTAAAADRGRDGGGPLHQWGRRGAGAPPPGRGGHRRPAVRRRGHQRRRPGAARRPRPGPRPGPDPPGPTHPLHRAPRGHRRGAAGEPARALAPVVTTEPATGETRHLAVGCHPDRKTADGAVESVLVLVTDVTASTEAAQVSARAAARAEAELAALRETAERQAAANRQLLAANRELTDAVDRLREQGGELRQAAAAAQVAAEEIETLNEELQSSNEELETLHEEAQATVEELNVANDELHARATELGELAAAHAEERARLTAVLGGMGTPCWWWTPSAGCCAPTRPTTPWWAATPPSCPPTPAASRCRAMRRRRAGRPGARRSGWSSRPRRRAAPAAGSRRPGGRWGRGRPAPGWS
jgi:two-component system CheB/CheR fusion protein